MKGAQCDENFASIHLSKVSPIKSFPRDVIIALSIFALVIFNYLELSAALLFYGLACERMRSCSCAGIHKKPAANQYWRRSLLAFMRTCACAGSGQAVTLHYSFLKAYQRYLIVDFVPVFRGVILITVMERFFMAIYIVFVSPG